jgi:hypothetical protein
MEKLKTRSFGTFGGPRARNCRHTISSKQILS